ncbi:MAG TPA: RcnB family protein [Rhizomicrobium sp.]|nr:RcnB family protein [Rhizomicrobium sp.]
MKRLFIAATALTLLATPMTEALAQPSHGPMMMRGHDHDWHKGGHIGRDDWGRGVRVDYRRYRLSRPPRGYEWRRVDDNFVLAAAATGLIAGVVLASH